MVDNVNPTSQFHPYQPQDAVPAVDRPKTGGLGGILSSLGIDQSKIGALGSSLKNVNVQKARTVAQNNGGLVLGGLAALAIGAGLLRRRR
jgi:LPXTG-motif cell wall-anchored protein